MHICILLLTLQIVLTIGLNGDKLPPDFKKIEPTPEIFSGLPSTKEEPVTAEELQAVFKEAEEEKQKYLKAKTPNELELEKIQEEFLKQLQSTPESAGATTAANPTSPDTAGKPATPDTAAKPATPDAAGKPATPATAAKPASSPAVATKPADPKAPAGKSPPAASTVPAVTPGATTGAPKSGKLLRRARVRLARRAKYTITQPFLKKGEVIKVKDIKFIPGDPLIPGAVGQVVLAQMIKKKDPTPVTVVMKAVPRYYAGDRHHAAGQVTERYLSLKAEYDAMMVVYSKQPFAEHFLIKPILYHEEDHRAFLVLEYAEGGALVDYMPNNLGRLGLNHRTIIRQIISGVLTIHRSRYGHRDLKPDNIFVRKTISGAFQPVIGDLGNATPLNSPERSEMGTRIYAAPEYFMDFLDVDFKKTDAFSVGAIFYAMIFQDFPLRQDLNVPKTEAWGPIMFSRESFIDHYIDPVAADFVQRLCYPIPSRRMTLDEALNHPYLNSGITFEDYIKSLGHNPWWQDKIFKLEVISYSLVQRQRVIRNGPIPQPIRSTRLTLRIPPVIPPLDLDLLDEPPVGTIAPPNTPRNSGTTAPPNTPRPADQASGTAAPPNTPRNSGITAPPNTPRGQLV